MSKDLADFYETSKHTPDDPKVQASYKALADETADQWEAIHEAGYKLEPWTGEGEPYANSAAMIADVRNNKHLYYKPSDTGFGTGAEGQGQLMLGESRIPGVPVNDVFRAVHDFFGHAKEGNQFGPKGEFNAWLIHSDMYSPEAQGALAAETLAQNSQVNFGKAMRNAEGNIIKKGEPGYLGPTERPFAEQKNFVVPDELIAQAKGAPKGTADSIIKAGGGTFTPEGRAVTNTHGYQVSIAGHEKTVPVSQLTPEKADQLFAEYGELAKQNGGSVGVWIEGDNAVWDVSKHFTDRDKAIEFGKANNQRAIWDWGKGEAENLGTAFREAKGDRGRANIIADYERKMAAKNKQKPTVQVTDATRKVVDDEVQVQEILDNWIDQFKGGAPKKDRVITKDNRRYYEGVNFSDIPGLNRVAAGDEAIVRALNKQEGPVWDKIVRAAEEEVKLGGSEKRSRPRFDFSDAAEPDSVSAADLEFDPLKFEKGAPKGTIREEDFNFPGDIDRTYRGPERRKLPRAEGTIREEEFNWPEATGPLPKDAKPDQVVGYNPKRGKIVLKQDLMDQIADLIGANDLGGLQVFAGPEVSGSGAKGRAFIQQLKKEFPKEFAMVPVNKPLTIQKTGTIRKYKETARHEATHGNVQAVVGRDLGDVIDTAKFSQEGRLAWQQAAMKKRQYDIKDRMDEVLADLATGNVDRLGVGRVEGLQLLNDILTQIERKYGPDKTAQIVSRFAPRFGAKGTDYTGRVLGTKKVLSLDDVRMQDTARRAERIQHAKEKGTWKGMRAEEGPEPTWYGTAKERLEEIGKQHGIPLETLAGVAAALSPNNKWAQNLVDVKKWAAAFKAGTLTETSSAGTFGGNRKKAFRILNGEAPEKVLSGPKVNAFYKALLGQGDDPVIDFHMANILRGSGYQTTKNTKKISAKEYKELADQLLREATAAGMKPADYQAKRWIEHRQGKQKSLFPERGGE